MDEVVAIVGAWESVAAETSVPLEGPAWNIRWQFEQFQYKRFVHETGEYSKRTDKSDWFALPGYFPALPVSAVVPLLFPLVRFVVRVRGQELELAVRLVAYYAGDDGVLHAEGWRYESADNTEDGAKDRFHHFPHVQRINGWDKRSAGFHPPSMDEDPALANLTATHHLSETRPAFPLPSKSPAGILVSAITSMYGAERTWRILETAHPSQSLRAEVEAITRMSVDAA